MGNGRVKWEMEESKGKWKSRRRNGKSRRGNERVERGMEIESKERSSNQQVKGVEVELVKCNTWIG
jgi:hypothetical protein